MMNENMTREEKDVLYKNNYQRKSFQWELWAMCNNLCDFCYLGKQNRHTDYERQMISLNDFHKAIDHLDCSKYNNISLIGGEFFQGQLDDVRIHDSFMSAMWKMEDLYLNHKIGSIWLTITMTKGDQHHLYEILDKFDKDGFRPHPEYGSSGLWLCTSYDTKGRFHTEEARQNWDFHMKNIYEKYPWVKFNTTCILTVPFIRDYINGSWAPRTFSSEYHTSLFYKQPGVGSIFNGDQFTALGKDLDERWMTAKRKINEMIGWDFLPKRELFLEFLKKYAIQDPETFDKLFNIRYRSDELHRNYNEDDHDVEALRFKDTLVEEVGDQIPINKCGHNMFYAAYQDNNKCTICDREMIAEAMGLK